MIVGGNCVVYIVVVFDRLVNVEVLIKGLCIFNIGLLYVLIMLDFIGCVIILECVVIYFVSVGRWIVRVIVFDDVIFNEWVLILIV